MAAVTVYMRNAESIRVLAISGSLRRASTNSAVIAAAARLADGALHVIAFEGLALIPPFNPDLDDADAPETVRGFRHAVETADAVLISSPEYAHGVPGVLKNALDWLVASGEFIDKPVAVINASSRATHAWTSLVETLTTMSANVVAAASITLPLDGRGSHMDAILSDPALTRALRDALDNLAGTATRR